MFIVSRILCKDSENSWKRAKKGRALKGGSLVTESLPEVGANLYDEVMFYPVVDDGFHVTASRLV